MYLKAPSKVRTALLSRDENSIAEFGIPDTSMDPWIYNG